MTLLSPASNHKFRGIISHFLYFAFVVIFPFFSGVILGPISIIPAGILALPLISPNCESWCGFSETILIGSIIVSILSFVISIVIYLTFFKNDSKRIKIFSLIITFLIIFISTLIALHEYIEPLFKDVYIPYL